ncbi:MAG: hypothetical protein ABI654_04400 [Betaproteobacteria bacterium]
MKRALLVVLVAGCSGGPVPPDWQLNAHSALNAFQSYYLKGDTRGAQLEFDRARTELQSTGRADLVARAELLRCAARAASLEFDICPGFEKLRADAGAEEMAYADFLSGRIERAATDDPLSRLVSHGVKFNSGKATPENISAAIDIASAQGWRRPLLAWLGVQEKRAEAAGDREALERIRRRIALASGKP